MRRKGKENLGFAEKEKGAHNPCRMAADRIFEDDFLKQQKQPMLLLNDVVFESYLVLPYTRVKNPI